jgi:D-alanine-D-alanine ligase-like ATP-grasp enzyme/acylphosphatase
MTKISAEWLPHLSTEIVSEVQGNLLDAYAVALEGWRRGLTLRWHAKNSEKFNEITTWYVDEPGQLFSLSSKEKTHYFFRTRGDKVTNEAVAIGKDKERTKQALKKKGVPTPEGRQFHEDEPDEAVREYVSSLGYPLVLKPTDGSFGRGVVTNIKNKQDLEYALNYVRTELNIKNVIAEQYIPGEEYRIYVVGNQVVGAINRIPANIIGDGVSSIDMLVANKNKDRELNPRLISCPLKIDAETERFIGKQGYTKASIPKRNEKVFLSKKSNISSGGDPIDILDELSEEIKAIAVNALKSVPGLEHGAVDLIINPDESNEKSGYVLELNPTAQIGSILYPLQGKSRDVPNAIIDYYFPETKGLLKKPLVYFDFHEVLAPIARKAAIVTEVANLQFKELIGKKYTVAGDIHRLAYHQKIKEKAIEQSLMGKISKIDSDKIDVVIVGQNKEAVEQCKQYIIELDDSSQVKEVSEEDWNQPIKLGFEIQGGKKSLLAELDKLEDDLIETRKEHKKLKKQYHNMLRSNSWKVTEPIRKFGGTIKKLVKTRH